MHFGTTFQDLYGVSMENNKNLPVLDIKFLVNTNYF